MNSYQRFLFLVTLIATIKILKQGSNTQLNFFLHVFLHFKIQNVGKCYQHFMIVINGLKEQYLSNILSSHYVFTTKKVQTLKQQDAA